MTKTIKMPETGQLRRGRIDNLNALGKRKRRVRNRGEERANRTHNNNNRRNRDD
jgi:hypothetical protein